MLSILAAAMSAPVSVSGWVVLFNPKSVESLTVNGKQLNDVMIELIKCDVNGNAVWRDEFPRKQYTNAIAVAKKHRNRVFAMTSNYLNELGGFSAKPVQAFLKSPEKMNSHIRQLCELAKSEKLDGIDLDYESLEAQDRDKFSEFVEKLGVALRKSGRQLSVTVHPKDSEPGNWDGPQAQDWVRLGKAADVFRVMAYDMHWDASDPGSIAGTAWVDRVMRFALTKVPKTKLEMGVATYGYDWTKKPARSLTFEDVAGLGKFALAPDSGERVWDKVYFGGPEAVAEKLRLSQKLGLRGISCWYIGSEDPATWTVYKPQ